MADEISLQKSSNSKAASGAEKKKDRGTKTTNDCRETKKIGPRGVKLLAWKRGGGNMD